MELTAHVSGQVQVETFFKGYCIVRQLSVFRLYDQNSTTGLHADSSMSTGQAEAPKQRPLRALYLVRSLSGSSQIWSSA